MATAKVLQKPKIIEIIGSTIRIAHPDISGYTRTYLTAPIAVGGTTMTVADNNYFADDDWFIIGEPGDSETEENDVNGTVTRGTSVTVTNTLKFAHEVNAPVTKINERGIKIYGAATDGGSGTLIASVDAITTPIADAVMIQWNNKYTEYRMISTDTTYAYYYVTFTDGTTASAASDYVASTGLASSSVEYFIQQALINTNSEIDSNLLKREDLVKAANDCQTAITQFKYQDPRSGNYISMNWPFEVAYNTTTLTVSTGKHEYATSGLTSDFKYNSPDSIISLRIGTNDKLTKRTIQQYDEDTEAMIRTDAASTGAIGATTLTVDSNVEFSSSGTLYSGANTITYTGKSGTTGFTGIPASGTGSITATIAVDDPVWQGVALGTPTKYSYFNGNLYITVPPKSALNGYALKMRYFKKLTSLTEASDTTVITFTNVFQLYLQSWIERRKGNEEKAILYMKEFNDQVLNNALSATVPVIDVNTYYTFENVD